MSPTPRTPQRPERRRSEILATARSLFEAEGIARVTTGRIAEVAGISPGNLYYWFPNKTAIVRALFDEWADASAIPLDPTADADELLRTLWRQAGVQAVVSERFGFFARELFPLLHADPVLAERYRAHAVARIAALTAAVETVIAGGLLVAPPPTRIGELVALTWLVSETATPFAQLVGSDLLDPGGAVRAVLVPLLTDRGREVVGLGAWQVTR